MTDEHVPELEIVYIAGNIREAEALEAFFAEQEIEYEVIPCQFEHSMSFGGVFAGVSFQVLAGQAPYCRRILLERGFTKGLVPSTAT
jgi:hypothetical protein